MSRERYLSNSNRPSDTDWLGQIPQHWGTQRLKTCFRVVIGGIWGDEPAGNPGDVRCVRVADYNFRRLEVGERNITFRAVPQSQLNNRLLIFGDVIIEKSGGGEQTSVGRAVTWFGSEPAVTSNFMARLQPNRDVSGRYLTYAMFLLHERKVTEKHVKQTTGIQNLDLDSFLDESTCLPPLPEQQAIAAFLDRETARIDALIARKERLLELLEEKRKAIISQAVTRGLDASVPMKDSGVEWLGQVPEGWAVQRLKNLSRFVTSGSRGWAEFYADSGSTFIRIGNLQRRSIDPDLSDIQYVNVPAGSEGERTRIQDGDVLISITADLGSVAAAGVNLQGAYVSQHVALVRLQSGINPRWLAYAVMGDTAKSHFKMASYGGTKIQLSLEDVRETPVFVPPPAEQQAIALYLDTQAAKLDALRQKMKQSVEKLSEYRTSLISAAVTGKIDVRGEVPDQKDVSA